MTHGTPRRLTRIESAMAIVIVGIVAIGTAPRLRDAQGLSSEVSAIASLKVTTTAQVAYAASCGNGGYAADYFILGTPVVAGAEPFISDGLGDSTTPERDGYAFTMGPGLGNDVGPNDCLPEANPTNTTFYATAVPVIFGQDGTRSFAVNADNVIWQDEAAAAPMEPFSAPARPIR